MTRERHATTIAEVARHADVSPATVSRVMNGRFFGDPAVAERVRASAVALAYMPNHTARSLALGQTQAVAFVVPDLSNPAFQAVLTGLSKTAGKEGYRVLVADSAESPSDEPLLATEIRRRCDAIVLCAPRMPHDELVALSESLRPLVLINRAVPEIDTPTLSIDYRSGIRDLAQHVYDLGHRHLVYLEGPPQSASNAHRLRGLDDFAAAVPGVRVDRVRAGVTSDDGFAARTAVRDTGATAALAFNDLVAVGLLNGLIDLGVRVPDDVSVTGFDDIPFARFTAPSLTTASVGHAELGVEAWARMSALLAGDVPGDNVVYAPRVEVRASTGPAIR